MNIEELIKENKELKNKLNQGKECPDYSSWQKSAEPTLAEYIEAMAAAFCKFTDANPHDCVLHTGVTEDGKKILYWFENKGRVAEGQPNELKHIEKTNYISS